MTSTTMIYGRTIKATREEIATVISGIAYEGSTGLAYTATPHDLHRHAGGSLTDTRLAEVSAALVVAGLVGFTLAGAPGALGSIALQLTRDGQDWAQEEQDEYEREQAGE